MKKVPVGLYTPTTVSWEPINFMGFPVFGSIDPKAKITKS
jgi:hypothetical protein